MEVRVCTLFVDPIHTNKNTKDILKYSTTIRDTDKIRHGALNRARSLTIDIFYEFT